MPRLCECPRCGERSFEKLKTYAHCSNCLYAEDSWESPEAAYFKTMKAVAEIEKAQQLNEIKEQKQKEENEVKNCA